MPQTFDGIIIDDLPEETKVKVFNESERCISYDTQTAYSGLSALCGCLSIVIPEKGKTRSDYLTKDETNYGVTYGTATKEIDYAKKTMYLRKQYYQDINEQSKKHTKEFVRLCEETFYEH